VGEERCSTNRGVRDFTREKKGGKGERNENKNGSTGKKNLGKKGLGETKRKRVWLGSIF